MCNPSYKPLIGLGLNISNPKGLNTWLIFFLQEIYLHYTKIYRLEFDPSWQEFDLRNSSKFHSSWILLVIDPVVGLCLVSFPSLQSILKNLTSLQIEFDKTHYQNEARYTSLHNAMNTRQTTLKTKLDNLHHTLTTLLSTFST